MATMLPGREYSPAAPFLHYATMLLVERPAVRRSWKSLARTTAWSLVWLSHRPWPLYVW
ncbi:MAG: hypothetical protein ABI662_05080 [Dermatophilaceae bacterium]